MCDALIQLLLLLQLLFGIINITSPHLCAHVRDERAPCSDVMHVT